MDEKFDKFGEFDISDAVDSASLSETIDVVAAMSDSSDDLMQGIEISDIGLDMSEPYIDIMDHVGEPDSDILSVMDDISVETDNFDQGTELDIMNIMDEAVSDTFAEITDEPSIGDAMDVAPLENLDTWLNDINPNFDEFDVDSPYSNNCGSCAYAVYQRLEGNPDICATAENIGYNDEMEALTGMEQVAMSPEEIQASLLEQGDGAHAIIGIDRAEGPGHWFNAACIDGKVVAIDGQTGEITDWPPDYGDVVNWEMSVKKGE